MSFATSLGSFSAAVARVLMAPLGSRHSAKALASLSEHVAPVMKIRTVEGEVLFRCPSSEATRLPGRLNSWEPMTFKWLREVVRPEACLWDIGAHIGVITLPAGIRARAAGGTVVAFEPSAASYAALNDNIMLNGLSDAVVAYGLALSDRSEVGRFHMTDPRAANAGHAFGAAEAYGKAFTPKFSQGAFATTMDAAVETLGIPQPDFIKLDVDSIEDRILAGGPQTLKGVQSLLIEIEPERDPAWVEKVRGLLTAAGLRQDPRFERDEKHSNFVFSRL